jgi:hypothetical protein
MCISKDTLLLAYTRVHSLKADSTKTTSITSAEKSVETDKGSRVTRTHD